MEGENIPKKLIEHLVQAYQLFYEAVKARVTMERIIKNGGNYGKYQRVQAQ